MTDEKKKRAPAAPMDRGWIVAVCVAILAAAAVLIFAPEHSIESVGAWIDRLPAVGQLAILIGAIASAVAMLRNSRKGPPSVPPPPAVLALLGALAIGGLASGCVSAVRVHATVASTAGATIDTWCQEERARREADMRAAEAAHPIREDAAAAVAAVRASYEDEIAACGVAKGVHDGWFKAITLGSAGAPFDPVDVALRFIGPFLTTWEALARATARSEHPLPPPPEGLPELAALAGGAR